MTANATAFDQSFKAIDGGDLKLADYRGKVLLVVNTASFCGFTPQYEGLQALWQSYETQGLVVVGVPSNDFGGQEPKDDGEIATFCKGTFGVTFPLAAKVSVRGAEAHAFYKWVTDTHGFNAAPQWNFHKYLVNRKGLIAGAFASSVMPGDPVLKAAIEAELKASAAANP